MTLKQTYETRTLRGAKRRSKLVHLTRPLIQEAKANLNNCLVIEFNSRPRLQRGRISNPAFTMPSNQTAPPPAKAKRRTSLRETKNICDPL